MSRHAPILEADTQSETTLYSITRPVSSADPLRVYAAFRQLAGDAVFWEQSSTKTSLVGGAWALEVPTQGEAAISQFAASWRRQAVRHQLPPDVIAFAGFAFRTGQRAPHWQPFGDGLLLVPGLLFRFEGRESRITLTFADEDDRRRIEALARRILSSAGEVEAPRPNTPGAPQVLETPDPATWQRDVANAVSAVRSGAIQKVVLARELQITGGADWDDVFALSRLRERYDHCTVFAWARDGSCFLGATPERLLRREHHRVYATCLAGSTARGQDLASDQSLSEALLVDRKERHEHQLVVGEVREGLTPFCSRLFSPQEPTVLRMPNVQHLYTPIEGLLSRDWPLLSLVEALHPTPAVAGLPRQSALSLIEQAEPFDRGWYAGPLGWLDGDGDGEFVVAIRSALLSGRDAYLYAGCGIVADSKPEKEFLESRLKLEAMLWALGLK